MLLINVGSMQTKCKTYDEGLLNFLLINAMIIGYQQQFILKIKHD